jgi:Secretion system C-terminal sorting domain/SprB repeat
VVNTVKMKKLYSLVFAVFVICITILLPKVTFSQACSTLTATYITTESRCAATGKIQINAAGGSGSYQYKVSGPVNTNYTSVSLITGLSAGKYQVTIKDIITNCIRNTDSVTVPGNYVVPSFFLVSTRVTCINGSDGKITVTGANFGRPPFSYKIVAPSASHVGATSTTGAFTGLLGGAYLIQLSDSCGAIQTRSITVDNYDWFINNYAVSKIGCDTISVTINLKDSKNFITPNAVFNGFLYGASVTAGDTTWFTTNTFKYKKGKKHTVQLLVKDPCGNIRLVTWTDAVIPKVNTSVTITNLVCLTFTATITGQVNLTAPSYCIYNGSNVLVTCNTTGVFNALPYGSYCIKITDACYDTTINRCFTVNRPIPAVDLNVNIVTNCNSFTAAITGQVNINDSSYCLYSAGNVLLVCNATGVFSNLAFGTYCIKVFNRTACYDTTITRCFTVKRPIPTVNPPVKITNLTCLTFTATIGDTANLSNPQFCLYTAAHVLIICNKTGVFNNLPYGTYCIDVVNDPVCYDTTIKFCFTVNRPIPSVGATVAITNKNCTSFTAGITGQTYLNNPQYCLYNSLNVLVTCNATGIFTNLAYGSYCIAVKNNTSCYDTVIKRCFTEAPTPIDISLSAKKSCATIGTTDLKVTFNSGTPAYTVSLFSPAGALMQTISSSSGSYTFLSIANLVSPLKYKITVTDQCGKKDSLSIAPNISVVNRAITIAPKCPSGTWPNGSADVIVNISSNNIGGDVTPKIIKKDGTVVSVNASSVTGNAYTFLNLGPGTYIFDTYINDCNTHVYDTTTVGIYLYPILSGSNAFQCDNGGFSVSVNVQGGVAPYTYEIIGSTPASPSIVSAPQASPVFSLNNGTTYSLIRLRVIDGCGNASLYDVSVLPLSNFVVVANSAECFNNSLTLRVDSIANAVYTWYKRKLPNDSIIVGTGPTYFIPNLLLSDTGRYFCRIVVNNSCLIKYANYKLRGGCFTVLPNDAVILEGQKQDGYNKLNWNKGGDNITAYSLQKSSANNTGYQTINSGGATYSFTDSNPFNGSNYYRLKLTGLDNSIKYSNVVLIKNNRFNIDFYPNPVSSILNISIAGNIAKNYLVEINNMMGQKIMAQTFYKIQDTVINYPRNSMMAPGVYILTITDLLSNEKQAYKLIYK